jgi:hypothetical protein
LERNNNADEGPDFSFFGEGASDRYSGHVAPYLATAEDGTIALWDTTPSKKPVHLFRPQFQSPVLTATRVMPDLEAAAPWSEECQCNSSSAFASLYTAPIDLPGDVTLTP